jgi:ABC-2 type transport system permease protein
MRNLFRVSQKEFVDLLSSRMVLIILAGFFIIILLSFINLNYAVPVVLQTGIGVRMEHVNSFGLFFSDWLFMNLIGFFGPIVGIIIGCSSIVSERQRNALNTLLVKPLYRDTIINGKIIGSLAFLALVVTCAMAFYTSLVLILYGNLIAPTLGDYISMLPIIFIFSMTMISIFVSMAILLSLLIRNQTFALIFSTIILYLFDNMEGYAHLISGIFPEKDIIVRDLLVGLTPTGSLMSIRNNLFISSRNILDSFQVVLPDLIKFLLYVTIACVVSYIIFVRRDEA